MNPLQKTYRDIRIFVDSFVNSTTPNFSSPAEMPQDAGAWYATREDNYIDDLIDNPLAKSCLRKIADSHYAGQMEELMHHSTELTASSYPSLYSIYSDCCHKLGFVLYPKLYVTGQIGGINALSIEVKRKRLILLSRMAAVHLSEPELKFILGHELGHHQQGNLVCHTVNGLLESLNSYSEVFGPMMADTIEVPMKRWCRQSEFNADRAGYICCGDMKVVSNLFEKLGMLPSLSAYHEYKEMETAHPHLNTRLAALKQYVNGQDNIS